MSWRALTDQDAKEQLCVLVAPWLPDAEVESLEIQQDHACYSEWTQEPASFYVTFRATHSDERRLAMVVSVIEPIVMQWAMRNYRFSGGTCCQGENYKDGDTVEPSLSVRVIPRKKAEVVA